ncbi:hypothetical protein ACHAQJ_009061 [Trichoderma viride]
MGLIVDQMSVINDSFKTIGVHCHPRKNAATTETITSSPERQIYIHPLPEKLRLFPFNSGASKTMARLYNIKQLRVQKKPANDEDPQAGLRYSGLWIYHTDESIDTLGPWNGSSTVPSDLIYDSETDGHLLRLIFRLTRGGKWKDRTSSLNQFMVETLRNLWSLYSFRSLKNPKNLKNLKNLKNFNSLNSLSSLKGFNNLKNFQI